jgi:hypothetical protein
VFDAPNMLGFTHHRRVFLLFIYFLNMYCPFLVSYYNNTLSHKFICRHFGIDWLAHFCGTV